jgi:prevent-host-death family protein
MPIATIHQAKTNLSKLIERAERGEEVLIARGDKVVAKLVPIRNVPKQRRLDLLKGKFIVPPEFFEPLPEEDVQLWGH